MSQNCNCCDKPEFPTKAFIPGPIEIPIDFRAVTIPAEQGDDTTLPPLNGAYRNVILRYAANGHTYIYSSDGIPVMLIGSIHFDTLQGRPKYDGQPMTSNTDIPDLSDEVSQLQLEVQALATDFSYKGSVTDYAHLPNDAAVGDVYTTEDTGLIYVWDGNEWVALNESGKSVQVFLDAPIALNNQLHLYKDQSLTENMSFFDLFSALTSGKLVTFEWHDDDEPGYIYIIYPLLNAVRHEDDDHNIYKFRVVGQDRFGTMTMYTLQGQQLTPNVLTVAECEDGIRVGSGAPTSADYYPVGTVYVDTSTGDLYTCTDIDMQYGTSTWTAVGGGATTKVYIDSHLIGAINVHAYKDASLTDPYYDTDFIADVQAGNDILFVRDDGNTQSVYQTNSTFVDEGNITYSFSYNASNGIHKAEFTPNSNVVSEVDSWSVQKNTFYFGRTASVTASSWSALSSSDPYDYSTTLYVPPSSATITNDSDVELINDNAVLFANYGFAIGAVSGQNVTIYSIGQPSSSVTFKINVKTYTV